MTDIFFSYSSADRERVRPIRDALVAQGFEVFWDQQVPGGMDWDTWIRQHLTKSKCAMAFWSATSVSSDNVRHEATVAKQQGKLISVLLEPLTAEQFPMGLYVQQAANLSGWSGDYSHDEWRKFRREFEAKLTPLWVRRQIDELEAELVGERTRREGAERRDKVLQAQIAKEAEVQQYLKEERDIALDEVAALKATVEELTGARSEAEVKQAETQQGQRQLDKSLDETKMLMATIEELNRAREEAEEREAGTQQELKREHDKAFDEAAALRATVEELTRARADAEARAAELSQHLRKVRQSKAQGIARSFLGVAIPLLVLAAVVATIGFWTLGTSSRLASPRGELSVEPRFLIFAVRADRGFYKWEANKKVMLRATGGPASWAIVYGFVPELTVPRDSRLEFSVHPEPRGWRHSHTLAWEFERTERIAVEPKLSWPNAFSRLIGDKVFGLLLAHQAGLPVPRTTVINRRVAPFTFGQPTSTAEFWLRTSPTVQVPGKFTTTHGWTDPFTVMHREDPKGVLLASIISQAAIPSKYSGAAIVTGHGELHIEGVSGKGERLMRGSASPEVLPQEIRQDVTMLFDRAKRFFGSVRFEWVHDGKQAWIVQLHRGQTRSTAETVVPGEAARWVRFDTKEGLEALRTLLSGLSKNSGLLLSGDIGLTSHIADVIRRAGLPARIESKKSV